MQSLVQMRSVRSRMPRSTRAPPDAQRLDLEPGVPGPQLVEQAVDRERLAAHAGHARRAVARVDAGRGCGPTSGTRSGTRRGGRRAARAMCAKAAGFARSSTCCWRAAGGSRSRARQDPVGVRTREVGVGVDHLGLHPEAELHAEADARGRASGCRPSGQTSASTYQSPRPARVVAAAEPNQPSSSTNRSTPRSAAGVREAREPVEVVVEVHRLPRVEGDRPRPPRVVRAAAQVRVEPARQLVEAVAPGSDSQGDSYDSPGASRTSPGSSSSPPPRNASPEIVRSATMRWLPLQATCTPWTRPRSEAEAGSPASRSRVASAPGRPAAALAQVGADGERHALGRCARAGGDRSCRAAPWRCREPGARAALPPGRRSPPRRSAPSPAAGRGRPPCSSISTTASRPARVSPARTTTCASSATSRSWTRSRAEKSPPPRWPVSPGVPCHPEACSGRTVNGTGASRPPETRCATWASASAVSVSSSSSPGRPPSARSEGGRRPGRPRPGSCRPHAGAGGRWCGIGRARRLHRRGEREGVIIFTTEGTRRQECALTHSCRLLVA